MKNAIHSAVLIGGMMLMVSACAWLLWGPGGVWWGLGATAVVALLTPTVPPGVVLSVYRAQRIPAGELAAVQAALADISRRAGLPAPPRLFYVPSKRPNAFAVGGEGESAIAVSDGMLRLLDFRELVAVLAHEVAHIAHGDLWLMSLAAAMERVTAVMAYIGFILLFLSVPLIAAGADTLPILLAPLLMLSPVLMGLLELALSRTREFHADLQAAELVEDPADLASALIKLEQWEGRPWHRVLLPGAGMHDPPLLQTHPATPERVRRLMEVRQVRRRIVQPRWIVYGAHRPPPFPRR